LLGWAIRLPPERTGGKPVALDAVVARLARAAAAAAYAANRHESARVLWLLGLNAAAADHADLRALVLSDVAEQHAALGYEGDAVAILRLAEGDERIAGDTRARLKAVRARADAADTAEDQS
jgi:hypothetical protein